MEPTTPLSGWQPALERFIEPALQAVREQPICDAILVDHDAIEPLLRTQLAERLLMIARRTLVLELNVARLLETLQGDTPQQRFSYFISRLRNERDAWDSIVAEYPILAERLHTEQQRFIANTKELLSCLSQDWELITQTFPEARAHSQLIAISGGMSDGHRGGRSVAKLVFANPSDPNVNQQHFQLLYKPKDLSVDCHFQDLLEVCNAAATRCELFALGQPFPSLFRQRLLPRGHYGWVEFLKARDCESAAEVSRFYIRQGGYLALMHVLHGTDVHFENVLACGEHPVLIDLETLFHQPFRTSTYDDSAAGRVEQFLESSVLRTGLLPGRAFGDDAHAGVNIGGLGNIDAEQLPLATAGWADAETDEMQVTTQQVTMPPGRNLPRLDGNIAPVAQHIDELMAGFEAMLRFIRSARDVWCDENGPLSIFANDEVRHVVRATTVYAKILAASTHPDQLRSVEDREQLLTLLAQADARVAPEILQSEQDDLRDGDVPFFTARPGSRAIWNSAGQCIEDHFSVDCLTAARERCRTLDEAEIMRQSFVVRAALSASAFGTTVIAPVRDAESPTESNASRSRAHEVAVQLGETLLRSAIHGKQDLTWIGMKFTGDAAEVARVDGDLYDGQAGIALFLAYLGQATGQQRFIDHAQMAARCLHRSLLTSLDAEACGGFVGLPSQLYALSHVAVALRESRLLHGIDFAVDKLHARALSEKPLESDVIYGTAGCILSLLSLHAVTRQERHLQTAIAFARRLISGAISSPAGAAWPSHAGAQPLLGFAHGTAGIYCALSRLSTVAVGHPDFEVIASECAQAAADALRHERAHFDAAEQNWPDLRNEGPAKRFMNAWCHGAPGVLLSRVATGARPSDTATVAELDAAFSTTLRRSADEHTLCHGEVGNLIIASRAESILQRAGWRQQIDARLSELLTSLRDGPRCGFSFPDAVPSLMTGISGIGYGMLSLSAQRPLPCVLSLDPPTDSVISE